MKTKIKAYLQSILQPITGIPEGDFVFDLKESIADKLSPYCIIVALDSTLEDKWTRDMTEESEKYTKYIRKIPIRVLLGGENEAQVDVWEEEFLTDLAKNIWLDGWPAGTEIHIHPGITHYTDNASYVRDVYALAIDIDFEYKINIDKSKLDAITGVVI